MDSFIVSLNALYLHVLHKVSICPCLFADRPHNVPSKKSSSYMVLLSSPVDQSQSDQSESPVPEGVGVSQDHTRRPSEGKDSEPEGSFKWKPFTDAGAPSSSAEESSDKGHSRSTSLDLNKMLMGSAKSGDGGLNAK